MATARLEVGEWVRTAVGPLAVAKQGVTAMLLHGELRAQDHDVGLTTVRKVLREHKRAKTESFIPLIYRPGEVGQVDFFGSTSTSRASAASAARRSCS